MRSRTSARIVTHGGGGAPSQSVGRAASIKRRHAPSFCSRAAHFLPLRWATDRAQVRHAALLATDVRGGRRPRLAPGRWRQRRVAALVLVAQSSTVCGFPLNSNLGSCNCGTSHSVVSCLASGTPPRCCAPPWWHGQHYPTPGLVPWALRNVFSPFVLTGVFFLIKPMPGVRRISGPWLCSPASLACLASFQWRTSLTSWASRKFLQFALAACIHLGYRVIAIGCLYSLLL